MNNRTVHRGRVAERSWTLEVPIVSVTEQVLKPNTTKAKVEKPKSDKPKVVKPKTVKKEKGADGEVVDKPEKAVKPKVKKDGGEEKDGKESKGASGKADKEGKGEKVKPVTGEEAVQVILAYLKGQNRPYSATEISANLHGKVSCASPLSAN